MSDPGAEAGTVLARLLRRAGLPAAVTLRTVDADGDGLDNRLTRAELADGSTVLLRQSRVSTASPLPRVEFLRGHGIPLPALHAADDAGASLWEYVPGRTLATAVADGTATDAVWESVGRELARVHAVAFPSPLVGDIGPESITLRPLDPVEDLIGSLEACERWVTEHAPGILTSLPVLVEAIRARSTAIRGDAPVITHGDLNLLNVVITETDEARLIDWDFPRVRPRLAELSAFDEHAYLHGLTGLPPAFFDGYGTPVDRDLLMIVRIVGCLGWLAGDDWVGWATTAMPATARRRLTTWHRRLLRWTDRVPDLVARLA